MAEITTKGRGRSVVEYVLGIFFVLLSATLLRSAFPALAFGPLCFGVFLILCGTVWSQLRHTCRKYSTLLSNDSSKSLDNLAKSVNSSASTVRSNIELMVKKGVLTNVAIDAKNNSVIVGSTDGDAGQLPNRAVIFGVSPKAVVVECSGCGAKKSIPKGKNAICEYCGTDLSA